MKPSTVQMEEKSSCFLKKINGSNVDVTSKYTGKVKSLLVLYTLQSHSETGHTSKHSFTFVTLS